MKNNEKKTLKELEKAIVMILSKNEVLERNHCYKSAKKMGRIKY